MEIEPRRKSLSARSLYAGNKKPSKIGEAYFNDRWSFTRN